MNKIYDVLIIDMNNLYHRAYSGDNESTIMYQKNKIQTQGISGSISRIQNYSKKFLKEGGSIYFLFDNSNGGERPDTIPSFYKENRKTYSRSFYRGLDYLEVILLSYSNNNFVLRDSEYEADNWVKSILESYKNKDLKTLLISTDLDFSRSISESTHWESHYNDCVYTPLEFKSKFGFEPSEKNIAFYKSFYGDKSDNITGYYKQMSPARFNYIIENIKDMKDFLYCCRERKIPLFNDSTCDRMLREKHNLTVNWELVSYKPISQKAYERYLTPTKENILKLKTLYKALNINVDSRCKSNNDIIDDMFSKEFISR